LFSRYNALALSMPEHQFIFGFLDTPLQKCINRTLARRVVKGNHKPFDPSKTLEPKFWGTIASRCHLSRAGRDVRDMAHERAFEVLLEWLDLA
jgi:hypothetical protein